MKKLIRGRALYTERNKVWIAKGMTYYAIDYNGNRVTPKYRVGNLLERCLAILPQSRLLLRQGIHHLTPLKDGSVFLTSRKVSYVVDKSGSIRNTFSGYVGNKPAHQGVCVTPKGTIFFGEYSVNLNHKNASKLFRSRDNGMTFETIYVFPKNVRHIHFIKYDPYEDCIWLGTGDADDECFLMKSSDEGDSWETIGSGSQDWRAIGVCFNEESLVWGTDAGSVPDQNHVLKMNRKTHTLEVLYNAEGPCHGCASFSNGKVFISTGIEGGENERDHFAHLKRVQGREIYEITKMEKNFYPLIMQYGVMRFPLGTENTDHVIFTALGLKKGLETIYILDKDEKGLN